jgi:predicted AAA+ superfamily ATPase
MASFVSFEQILNEHNEISSSLALQYPTLYKNFLKYLQIGFYPFFIEDEEEYKNKLFNALDKVISEDIPSINRIEYTHLSIFKKFIAKLIYSRVPFQVNISALSKEFGVSHPTLSTYLNILEQTKIMRPIRKFSTKVSKKPEKLLFSNTNILYTYANEFGIEVDVGTVRETFFASCFESIYYSDIGDFRVDEYIFEIGGRNKSFKQIRDVPNSYVVVDTDYTVEVNRIPLWLFGLMG